MMRRRFRRRRRPAWTYANAGSMVINSATATLDGQPIVYDWLLPPGRAQYLMSTRNRDSLTYVGSHIWMDFRFRNTANTPLEMPDVDFGVMKATIFDGAGGNADLSQVVGQWDQPETPASFTSWENEVDDGTNSFLWSHHIKGETPPNAIVNVLNTGGSSGAEHAINQTNTMDGTANPETALSIVCRKFYVTQEWQPDVVIKSRRRLVKGEGILLFMASDAAFVSGMNAELNFRWRTLSS